MQDLVLFNDKDFLILIIKLSSTNHGSRQEFSEFTTSSRRVVLVFFSHGEFTKRYNLNCNFLQYLQAIPKRLLEKAKQNLDPKFTFLQDNTFFQLSSTLKVNFLKSTRKDYYWLFINKMNPELKLSKKCARNLKINDIKLSS